MLPFHSYAAHSVCTDSLNASEQRELNSRMEKKQMKEFMTVCVIAAPLMQFCQNLCHVPSNCS